MDVTVTGTPARAARMEETDMSSVFKLKRAENPSFRVSRVLRSRWAIAAGREVEHDYSFDSDSKPRSGLRRPGRVNRLRGRRQ